MSLAPASSRGAFLKARLAVNGIQCAARSLGTLTAECGLLSSMAGLFEFFGELLSATLAVSVWYWNARAGLFPYGGAAFKAKRGAPQRPARSEPAIQNTSPSESSV